MIPALQAQNLQYSDEMKIFKDFEYQKMLMKN